MTNFRQLVPLFAARFWRLCRSRGTWRRKWETTKNLPRNQSTRSVTVSYMGYCSCLT